MGTCAKGGRLGRVGRAALKHAFCPVAIISSRMELHTDYRIVHSVTGTFVQKIGHGEPKTECADRRR